jgi:hypothetical protein
MDRSKAGTSLFAIAALVLSMRGGLVGTACTTDSEFGACGYGAELETRYACEGNVFVETQDNCPPKAPSVTRTDCSATGDQCLQRAGLPTNSGSLLFGCVHPCATSTECPKDSYCAGGFAATADGRSTCVPSLREGFACDPSQACASGLLCALKDGGVPQPAGDAGDRDAAAPNPCVPTDLSLPEGALGRYDCLCQRL